MRAAALPFKNLTRRPLRNVFAALGIALATGTFLAMSAIFGGVAENFSASLDARGFHAVVLQDQQVDWLASAVPEDLGPRLAAQPGVASATPELLAFLSTGDGTPVLVTAWPAEAEAWRTLGPGIDGPPPPGGAYIGEVLAEAMRIGPGGRMDLDGFEAGVVGIVPSDEPLMGARALVRIDELQQAMFREGTATSIQIRLDDPGDTAALEATQAWLATEMPGVALRPTADLERDNRVIRLLDVLRQAVVWTVALAGAAAVANTLFMTVNERRAEIGLLRALGWRPRQILALFLAEAGAISTIGGLAGLIVGWAIMRAVQTSATLAAFLSDGIGPGLAALAFALALGIGLLGGALPALASLRIPADTALRSG
jgi:putative ABC transport system permease protein